MNTVVTPLAHLPGQPHALHPLHHPERTWPQTNCSVDLMVELVAAYGHDPVWMMGFTLIQDFEGDHFSFFKVPSDDLEALYGLSIHELAVWDDLQAHVLQQVQLDRVVLVEVDGYHLPDTQGITYREAHGKTTIGIFGIDVQKRTIDYFHNEARGRLTGDDFDGVLQRLPQHAGVLLPYTEIVKCSGAVHPQPAEEAWRQLRRHWRRRPNRNPFRAYADALPSHLSVLMQRAQPYFHAYAFNTLRQFGANFGLLASLLARWSDAPLVQASTVAGHIANEAKVLQFKLARSVAKGKPDALVDGVLTVADRYDTLIHLLSPVLSLQDATSA